MLRLPWKRGGSDPSGRIYVSATRFTYRHLADLPLVFARGLWMRAGWGSVDGAVGVFLGADARARTTYTVSAWRSEASLRRWLRSPAHAHVARAYGPRMESYLAVAWETDAFDEGSAWREGVARLRDG